MKNTKEAALNVLIKDVDTNLISDGFHTFKELYDHRIALFIALCRCLEGTPDDAWRSIKHSDGSIIKGWFILGLGKIPGKQITYHLPIDLWEECKFAETLDKAPDYDGHTGLDVLERLQNLK